jgi:hypothetical protein
MLEELFTTRRLPVWFRDNRSLCAHPQRNPSEHYQERHVGRHRPTSKCEPDDATLMDQAVELSLPPLIQGMLPWPRV